MCDDEPPPLSRPEPPDPHHGVSWQTTGGPCTQEAVHAAPAHVRLFWAAPGGIERVTAVRTNLSIAIWGVFVRVATYAMRNLVGTIP